MVFGILDCFMIAYVCGVIFGLVYEIFRIIRRIFSHQAVVFVCDVCFFIAAAFFVFSLSMYLGNYIRLYTLLGFGAGIFTYIQTVGRVFSVIECSVIGLLKAVIRRVGAALSACIKKAIGAFAHNASAAFGRFHDFLLKHKKTSSPLLHFDTERVYNVKRNIINTGESIGGNNVIQAKIRRSS